jgi:hypothetical protein
MRRLYYSDDEFGQAFSELKNYREVPPVGNWREINARLDQRTTFRYTYIIGIAATLAVILSLGLSIYFSTEPARERIQAQKKDNLTKPALVAEPTLVQPAIEHKSYDAPSVSVDVDTKVANALQNIESGLAILNTREQDLIKPIKSIRRATFNAPLRSTNYRAYELLVGVDDDASHPMAVARPFDQNDFTSFYFGVNIQPQHTMLTNRSSAEGGALNPQFSPGMAYGVSAGFRLSDAWALETGGMMSQENQRYEAGAMQPQASKRMASLGTDQAQTEQSLQQYHLALNYYRIPLMVKFRMPWSQRRSIRDESVSLLAGMQYGYLRNGFNSNLTAPSETQTNVVTEDIKRSDVQVLSGVERSSAVSRHFSISYGFKVGYGLRQISSLETERVTKFNRPHNMNAAINLALTFSK